MAYNRRHLGAGFSIWISLQVFNKCPLELRKAISGLALWKTSNKKELNSIYEEFSLLPRDQFDDVLRYAWQQPHDFLFMDTLTDTYYRNFNELSIKKDE